MKMRQGEVWETFSRRNIRKAKPYPNRNPEKLRTRQNIVDAEKSEDVTSNIVENY